MTIRNKAFREAMNKAGLGKIELCKNGDYFYIYSEDEETEYLILSSVEDNMILCHAFSDMTIDGWVDLIKGMIGFYTDDLTADLWEANTELTEGLMIYEKSTYYTFHPGFELSIPGQGQVSASRALDYAEAIEKAVGILNKLNDKYKGRKLLYR